MRILAVLLLIALPSYAAVQQPSRRVIVMGDSIIAGTGLANVQHQATYELQRLTGLVIQTFAAPGATMADNTPPFVGMQHATEALDLLYGYFGFYGLVIQLGTNDWGVGAITPAAFSAAYDALLAAVPADVRVACLGLTWNLGEEGVPNTYGETRDDYRARIQAACEAHGGTYLDGRKAIPADPRFFADGQHPNDRGNRLLAAFLAQQLRLLGWAR
jgi:lysophospholipase L1-like esterase